MAAERNIERAARVAGILFIGGAVFCVLVAGYFFYYYSWTQQRCFSSWAGPLLSYGLPLGLAGLLVAALWFRPAYKLNLALLLISTGMAICLAELLFILTKPASFAEMRDQARQKAARAGGMDFDTRSRLQVVLDLQRAGIDAIPAIAPSMLLRPGENGNVKSDIAIDGTEVLPLGGVANKVTVLCNETGTYLIYRSDEHGFHNPQGQWTDGHVDIVTLGDSFTQGFCVPSDKNFVALIRRRWPATLNLGNQGNGPLAMLATLKEYAQPFRPKVVLWFYFENDLMDLRLEKNSPLLLRYVESEFSQGLLSKQTEIDHALVAYVESAMAKSISQLEDQLAGITRKPRDIRWLLTLPVEVIKLGTIRNRLGLVSGGLCAPDAHPDAASVAEIELFRTVLLKAQEAVSGWGGTLYFVFLPGWERYAGPQFANPNRGPVLTVARDLGLPVIDLHPIFQAHPDPLALFPFRQSGHYTEEGNRIVAEEVLRSISLTQEKRKT